MATIIEALDSISANSWYKEWQKPAWKQFLLTGTEGLLNFLPKFPKYSWLPNELLSALPVPDQLTDADRRFLQACLAAHLPQAVGAWLRQCVTRFGIDSRQFQRASEVILGFGCSVLDWATIVVMDVESLRVPGGLPTPAGEFILSLDNATLSELFGKIGEHPGQASAVADLLAAQAPERWKAILEAFNESGKAGNFDSSTWITSLDAAPATFTEVSARAWEILKQTHHRFKLGKKLYQLNSLRFGPAMEQVANELLLAEDLDAKVRSWEPSRDAGWWLVANRGTSAIPVLARYFGAALATEPWHRIGQVGYKCEVLEAAVQKLQRESIPLLEACFESDQPEVQLKALQFWAGIKVEADTQFIAPRLCQLLACKDSASVARAARLAGELALAAVEKEIWGLLSHKSRPVREAAATTFARLGDARLGRVGELWKVRAADTRLAAVTWLKALGTPGAVAALTSRLDEEEADNVRDAILLALEGIPGAALQADPAALEERIRKTVGKIKGPLVPWLDPGKLTRPKLLNGVSLSAESLLYLLYRQSRVKEMRSDIEARPLFQQLDRDTTGDLALAVVHAFFGSAADADDRWAMAFAALIGDDRLVPVFSRQIKEWADHARGKLAEYAVQALALLGTDPALLAVDALV